MVHVAPPESAGEPQGPSSSHEEGSGEEAPGTEPDGVAPIAPKRRKSTPPPLPETAPPATGHRPKQGREAAGEFVAMDPSAAKTGMVALDQVASFEEAEPADQIAWRKRIWLGAAGAATVILLVGAILLGRGPGRSGGTSEPPPPPAPSPPSAWIPQDAGFVLRVALDAQDGEAVNRLLDAAPSFVRDEVSAFLKEFGLRRDSIDRLMIAGSGELPWRGRSVITVRLTQGQEAAILETTGEATGTDWAGLRWFRRKGVSDRAFAVLDESTFVTGPDEMLESIAARSGPSADADSPLLESFLEEDPVLGLLIRGETWQNAVVPAASGWLAVWPEAELAWRRVSREADEFAWIAAGEGRASRVGLRSKNAGRTKDLADSWTALSRALSAQWTPDDEDDAGVLLAKAAAAFSAVEPSIEGTRVWIEVTVEPPLASLLASAAADTEGLRRWRLAAGKRAVEDRQAALSAGIKAFLEKQGRFPKAVAGEGLLPPSTRLSWIASLLPYYEHPDWFEKLDFGYGWKDSRNVGVAKRPLDAVVNPLVGPRADAEGFPVSHFVGVAGIGPDAADLPADDPRAGVFGNDRRIALEEIEDGASNTLAILGVVQGLGPWAAGGGSTVRGIAGRPVVNGPDGFGSGLPDGMIAGMADGSVRFLSSDIDPRVLEQMATIRGGAAQPVEPVEEREQPAAEPEQPVIDQREQSANAEVKIRLAERIPRFIFREKPLGAVLEAVGQLGNISLRVDEAALAQKGISLKTTVTVDRADASLDDILKDALSKTKLAYRIEKGGVWIFPAQ